MGNIATPMSGGSDRYQIIIHTDPGAFVTISKGNVTRIIKNENGVAMIGGLTDGFWTIQTELRGHTRTYNKQISRGAPCEIVYLHYNMVPNFSCSDMYFDIVTDTDVQIATGAGTVGNWKIRFKSIENGKTHGTIIFNDLKGQYIDVFLCGGGGDGQVTMNSFWGASGGGGGYTNTIRNYRAEEGVPYSVVIAGKGGTSQFSGGIENPISISAAGGTSGYFDNKNMHGGDGGCGGGGGAARGNDTVDSAIAGKSGNGGSDGNNGTDGADGIWYYTEDNNVTYIQVLSCSYGGNGQGYTTREFGGTIGLPYSPGGAGGALETQYIGEKGTGRSGANSGAGGSGTNPYGWTMEGQSGVVVIRNSRGQFGFPD